MGCCPDARPGPGVPAPSQCETEACHEAFFLSPSQDEMEFGYTEAPHKAFPVVFDSPSNRGLKDLPYKRILVGDTEGSCPALPGPSASGLQRDGECPASGVRGRLGSSMWMKWKSPFSGRGAGLPGCEQMSQARGEQTAL